MNLNGKTALITGSARGLGKAIAYKLGMLGVNIVLFGRKSSSDIEGVSKEFTEAGISNIVAIGDVRNYDEVESAMKLSKDTFGSLDILVNNAGITKDGQIGRASCRERV